MTTRHLKPLHGLAVSYTLWNPHTANAAPLHHSEWTEAQKLGGLVRRTTYNEVHDVLETSGCSPQTPYWVWSVMGVLQLPNGLQFVCPGDYIVQVAGMAPQAMNEEAFRNFILTAENARKDSK